MPFLFGFLFFIIDFSSVCTQNFAESKKKEKSLYVRNDV